MPREQTLLSLYILLTAQQLKVSNTLITIYNPCERNTFCNKMKGISKVSKETHLVTMDVKSPYTIIQNTKGIAATKRALDK